MPKTFIDGVLDSKDISEINLPKEVNFAMSPNGHKLHFRSTWPKSSQSHSIPKGFILSLHGYASHSSRPIHEYLANQWSLRGYVYLVMDFHGHGYSEGVRGLVESAEDLINDALTVLFAHTVPIPFLDFKVEQTLKDLPFYIMGHSMGGGTAIILSHLMHSAANGNADNPNALFHTTFSTSNEASKSLLSVAPLFKGAILFCPVVDIGLNWFVRAAVVTPLSIFAPETSLPEFFASDIGHKSIWASDRYIEYILNDRYPMNPSGLSWGGNIRFGSIGALLDLSDRVQSILSDVKYPFVIFHDKTDSLCKFSGSELMLQSSQTPESDKQLCHVENALHDILANKLEEAFEMTANWVETR
jgi:alpha-beta hydrolase superfamily lysophospholipase